MQTPRRLRSVLRLLFQHINQAFGVLARLKFLRGGPLDIFGRTAERKSERVLIVEYEALIGELLPNLALEKHRLAVELASLPEQIRGFGHVKEAALEKVRDKREELLAAWRSLGAPLKRAAYGGQPFAACSARHARKQQPRR